MCGIIGVVAQVGTPASPIIYDGLTVLQHRGQDAAGIVTCDGEQLFQRKSNGLFEMFSNSATWKPWLDIWGSVTSDTPLLEHLPALKPNRSTPIHRMEFHLPTMAT